MKALLCCLVTSVSLTLSGAAFADKATSFKADPNAAYDVAIALAQKDALDKRLRAAWASPEKEMRAICGKSDGNARDWAMRFGEQSFAELSHMTGAKAGRNPFMRELSGAFYGRSKIYMIVYRKNLPAAAFNGRMIGNDKRIEGVTRAATNAFNGLPSNSDIKNKAEKSIKDMISPDKAASACR